MPRQLTDTYVPEFIVYVEVIFYSEFGAQKIVPCSNFDPIVRAV